MLLPGARRSLLPHPNGGIDNYPIPGLAETPLRLLLLMTAARSSPALPTRYLSHREFQHIVSAALLVRIPLVSPKPRLYSYFHSFPTFVGGACVSAQLYLSSPLFVQRCASASIASVAAHFLSSSALPRLPLRRVSRLSFTACGSTLTRGRHGKQSETSDCAPASAALIRPASCRLRYSNRVRHSHDQLTTLIAPSLIAAACNNPSSPSAVQHT